jgi:hypothetical protein
MKDLWIINQRDRMGETEEKGKSDRGRMHFEGNNHTWRKTQHGKRDKLVLRRRG